MGRKGATLLLADLETEAYVPWPHTCIYDDHMWPYVYYDVWTDCTSCFKCSYLALHSMESMHNGQFSSDVRICCWASHEFNMCHVPCVMVQWCQSHDYFKGLQHSPVPDNRVREPVPHLSRTPLALDMFIKSLDGPRPTRAAGRGRGGIVWLKLKYKISKCRFSMARYSQQMCKQGCDRLMEEHVGISCLIQEASKRNSQYTCGCNYLTAPQ